MVASQRADRAFHSPASPVSSSSQYHFISYIWIRFRFVRVCFGTKQKRASLHPCHPRLPPGLCGGLWGSQGLAWIFCVVLIPANRSRRELPSLAALGAACLGLQLMLSIQAPVLAKAEGDLSSTSVTGGSLVPN